MQISLPQSLPSTLPETLGISDHDLTLENLTAKVDNYNESTREHYFNTLDYSNDCLITHRINAGNAFQLKIRIP